LVVLFEDDGGDDDIQNDDGDGDANLKEENGDWYEDAISNFIDDMNNIIVGGNVESNSSTHSCGKRRDKEHST